jgi:hypothetical protein
VSTRPWDEDLTNARRIQGRFNSCLCSLKARCSLPRECMPPVLRAARGFGVALSSCCSVVLRNAKNPEPPKAKLRPRRRHFLFCSLPFSSSFSSRFSLLERIQYPDCVVVQCSLPCRARPGALVYRQTEPNRDLHLTLPRPQRHDAAEA